MGESRDFQTAERTDLLSGTFHKLTTVLTAQRDEQSFCQLNDEIHPDPLHTFFFHSTAACGKVMIMIKLRLSRTSQTALGLQCHQIKNRENDRRCCKQSQRSQHGTRVVQAPIGFITKNTSHLRGGEQSLHLPATSVEYQYIERDSTQCTSYNHGARDKSIRVEGMA